MIADDIIPASTAGQPNQLECVVIVMNQQERILNDVIQWTIYKSATGISKFEFLAPEVNYVSDGATEAVAAEPLECVEEQLCNAVCIFGGRLVSISASIHYLTNFATALWFPDTSGVMKSVSKDKKILTTSELILPW